MLDRLMQFFKSPFFPHDEEKTRTARILHHLLFFMSVVLFISLAIGVPFFFASKLGSSLIILAFFLILGITHLLMRQGRVRGASILLIVGLFLLFTSMIALSGGLYSANLIFFLALTVVTGLLLGSRSALVMAIACSMGGLGILLTEFFGSPIPQLLPAPPLSRWAELTFALVLTTTTLGYALRLLDETLTISKREVHERRAAEDELAREMRLSDDIINSLPGLFYMYDLQMRLLRWNYKHEAVLEYTGAELKERTALDFIAPADRARVAERFKQVFIQGYAEEEVGLLTKSGKILPYYLTGMCIQVDDQLLLIGVAIDLTELKHAQQEREKLVEQLRQAQKMEAIGRLAGGVAHDFNNLLTAIIGHAGLALMKLHPRDPLRDSFSVINEAAESAATLTRQLLAFSRKQIIEPRVFDLHETIERMNKMVGRLIGEDIELRLFNCSEPLWIKADPSQIDQILINLAVNARDAMPGGGQLIVSLDRIDRLPDDLEETTPDRPFARLRVRDNGSGIAEEIREHIFEPFFTTKPVGKGTGLGLAMVYGAVKQNEGHVTVESTPGMGTVFTIYFPLSQSRDKRVIANDISPDRQTGRGETILFVEDEPLVREPTIQMLLGMGYRVLSASSGEEALIVVQEHAGHIDLLLTDVVMPGINGRELAEELRALQPDLKVLYTSGYSDEIVARHGVLQSGIHLLDKPYTPRGLAKKIREVLEE